MASLITISRDITSLVKKPFRTFSCISSTKRRYPISLIRSRFTIFQFEYLFVINPRKAAASGDGPSSKLLHGILSHSAHVRNACCCEQARTGQERLSLSPAQHPGHLLPWLQFCSMFKKSTTLSRWIPIAQGPTSAMLKPFRIRYISFARFLLFPKKRSHAPQYIPHGAIRCFSLSLSSFGSRLSSSTRLSL